VSLAAGVAAAALGRLIGQQMGLHL
jgi:hypothetical protein